MYDHQFKKKKEKKGQDVIYILEPRKSNQCDIFNYVDTKQIKKQN